MLRLALPLLALFSLPHAFGATTVVHIAFVEALAPRDTTSSERFQKDYDLAIQAGTRALTPRLRSCGYTLETETAFYDASDPLQAKEKGTELANKGTWLVVGPRRSNHYLLMAQGAPTTPTVSLMASASEVANLGPRHLSLSPLNAEMAKASARESASRLKGKRNRSYISVVSKDCTSCVDFADAYRVEATKLGLQEAKHFDVMGETQDTSAAAAAVKTIRPAFVLLPNFSKTATLFMSRLSTEDQDLFFVGSDGWGDSSFGFVHQASGLMAARGFSVRGYPPFETGLGRFALGRSLKSADVASLPKSGPALGILKSLEGVTDLLCTGKPKSPSEFSKLFEHLGRKSFNAPWGTSLYELKDGNLTYSRPLLGAAHGK